MQQLISVDRPLAGVLLTIGFCMIIPFSDALAKILMETVPLVTILAARFLGQALMSAPAMLRRGIRMSPRVFLLTFIRTVLQLTSLALIYVAFRYLPLADAIAISFVSPFLLMLMGKFFLGEQVGPRRIAACGVGFGGTLMVIQPSFVEVGAAALLPLACAVTFSLYTLTTRQVARIADPVTVQGVSGLLGLFALLAAAALGSGAFPDARIVIPSGYDAWLLVAIATIGSVAHMMMTWALRMAPAATLAPIQYVEIPFATLIGWLFFRDLPDGLAAAGILLIMSAGLYIIYRERVIARQAAATA